MENQATTEKKERRPQQWGQLGAIVAVIFVVLMAVYIPTGPYKRYKRAREKVVDLNADLNKVLAAKSEAEVRLESQKALMAALKLRKPGFDLWSFMNATLTEMKLKERASLNEYKPTRADKKTSAEASVMLQLRLSGLSLSEVVDFLYKIYSSKNLIVVHKLEYLRPTGDGKGLECNMVLLTPKSASGASGQADQEALSPPKSARAAS